MEYRLTPAGERLKVVLDTMAAWAEQDLPRAGHTGRVNGPAVGRGVIGHARSADLLNWEVRPPLTQPACFGHMEVPQVAVIDGQPLLLFCTNTNAGSDPIWIVPGPSLTGPWDMTLARPVHCPALYAPRLVRDAAAGWHLIGFIAGPRTGFVGELSDPIPVRYTQATGLTCDVVTPP